MKEDETANYVRMHWLNYILQTMRKYSIQKAVKLWHLTPGKKLVGLAQLNCLFSWVPCSVTALPLGVFASPISSFPRCWLVLPPRLLFWISIIHPLPPSSPHPTPVWPFIWYCLASFLQNLMWAKHFVWLATLKIFCLEALKLMPGGMPNMGNFTPHMMFF